MRFTLLHIGAGTPFAIGAHLERYKERVRAHMIGILIGTACLIGIAKLTRGSRYGRHGYSCGGGSGQGLGHGFGPYGEDVSDADGDFRGFGGGWGRGRFGGFGRSSFVLRGLSRRLNLTPAQETEFAKAFSELRDSGRSAKDSLKGTRGDVAKAMRSESFDEVTLGSVVASIEETTETLRKKGLDAFAKVHAVLDPGQREIFADIIERGPRGGFPGFGHRHPYRV